MKRVRCKSGLIGWQDRLQNVYTDLAEFRRWSDVYGLARRLGYRSAAAAWTANPLVRGSVIPSDYGVVRQTTTTRRPRLAVRPAEHSCPGWHGWPSRL